MTLKVLVIVDLVFAVFLGNGLTVNIKVFRHFENIHCFNEGYSNQIHKFFLF